MKDIIKIKKYYKDFISLLNNIQKFIPKKIKLKNILLNSKKKNKKIFIFGNGGSAAIASHFIIDVKKNTNLNIQNLPDISSLTCFANDYGFDNYIKEIISKSGSSGDLLILVSSSGKSKNMINALKEARKKNFSKIVTLTGFNKKNYLNLNGDLNFWVNSKVYNYVENIHQIILLSVIDLIHLRIK
jgi:D-sedoheptulose 7-phosphate isomerase